MSDLNLIPYEIRIKNEERKRKRKIILLSIAILLIMALVTSVPIFLTVLKERQNILLLNEINKLSYVSKETDKLNQRKKYMQDRLKIIDEITKQDKRWTAVISEITDVMPQDIMVSNIDFGIDTVNMQCVSSSQLSIASFVALLENNKNFSNVIIYEIVPSEESKSLNFSLSFTLKSTENKEK